MWTSRSEATAAPDNLPCQARGSRTSCSLLVVERALCMSFLGCPHPTCFHGELRKFSQIPFAARSCGWEQLSRHICFATPTVFRDDSLLFHLLCMHSHPRTRPFPESGTSVPNWVHFLPDRMSSVCSSHPNPRGNLRAEKHVHVGESLATSGQRSSDPCASSKKLVV